MWKRKRTLKEEYGTLGHFLRGDNDCHYLGDLCGKTLRSLCR